MRLSEAYRPDSVFARLGADFADPVQPARFPDQKLRWRNDRAAARVGLHLLDDAAWVDAFAQFTPLPGAMSQPLAMRYHGHQFRNYNPDLGDGRGFLFAQLRDEDGRLLDLGTKGSGQTPYSRFGDGRLTLKGGVREVLAAEMLEALGVKTSKALSLIETGEQLQRNDEPSPTRSSVLVRLQHSHIRFGSFQRCAYEQRADLLEQLAIHALETYYPDHAGLSGAAAATAVLGQAVQASAALAASWMAAGFVHGVLNTDNLVVTGESFDYGPWRFLPASIPGFTAAYFDESGLYCFARQPEAVAWALAQLGTSLSLLAEPDALNDTLALFPDLYREALRDAGFRRLGLTPDALDKDLKDLSAFFAWMTETQASWEQVFHDWFMGEASADRAAASPIADHYRSSAFQSVRSGLLQRAPSDPARLNDAYFQRPRPVSLLIDEVEALWSSIAQDDDWSGFAAKLDDIHAMRAALSIYVK